MDKDQRQPAANNKEDFDSMMEEFMEMLSFRNDAMRDEISDKVIVDTCKRTALNLWETAISIDGDETYFPVERYPDKEAAAARHGYWVGRATEGIEKSELETLKGAFSTP